MARKNPHAVALGRKGGSATSEAKQEASRQNGKKGGRTPHAETEVTITTRNVGSHFGTVGEVRRGWEGRGRIIHTTDPRPYGFRSAAASDAMDWAIARGYVQIDTSMALAE